MTIDQAEPTETATEIEAKVRKPRPARLTGRKTITYQLREFLRGLTEDGATAQEIADAAKIDRKIVARFLAEERGITLASLDKLAVVYGLKLDAPAKAKAKSPKKKL